VSAPQGVEPQLASRDGGVLPLERAERQRQRVHGGREEAAAERPRAGGAEERELERGVVRDEDPAGEHREQLGEHHPWRGAARRHVVGDGVDHGALLGDGSRREHEPVPRRREVDPLPGEAHPADAHDLVGRGVEAGRLEVDGEEADAAAVARPRREGDREEVAERPRWRPAELPSAAALEAEEELEEGQTNDLAR
jgi:hypothetical protein